MFAVLLCYLIFHLPHYTQTRTHPVCQPFPSRPSGAVGDQAQVAQVDAAEVPERRHKVPAAVHRQQRQQLQHPDHHVRQVQPGNAAGFRVPGAAVSHLRSPPAVDRRSFSSHSAPHMHGVPLQC